MSSKISEAWEAVVLRERVTNNALTIFNHRFEGTWLILKQHGRWKDTATFEGRETLTAELSSGFPRTKPRSDRSGVGMTQILALVVAEQLPTSSDAHL